MNSDNLSCQKWLLHRDYQGVNGGFTERAGSSTRVRLLKSKQENGPWKHNEKISLSLDCQQVRRWDRPVPALLQQGGGKCTLNSMGHSTFPLEKRVKVLSSVQGRIRAFKYHYEYLGITLRGKPPLKLVFHPLPFFGRGWNHTLFFWNTNTEYQPTTTAVQNKTYT